ncbi:attractin-like protein 1 isoform X2 [Ciona intestinalis]
MITASENGITRVFLLFVNITWMLHLCSSQCHTGRKVYSNSTFGYLSDGNGDYLPNQRCEWLIESPDVQLHPYIALTFLSQDTECSYDFITVHDGNTYTSKVIAKISGDSTRAPLHILHAHSGSMLLYFFRCSCNSGWIGTSCNQRGCPNNCNAPHGSCDFIRSKRCICNAGYIGKGCNLYTSSSSQNNSWTAVNNFTFFGDASPSLSFHAAEFVYPFLYIFGGYDLNAMKNGFYRYNFSQNYWTSLRTNMIGPAPRAFHTMNYIRTEYLDQLLIFGGQFENGSYSNDMWMFNITPTRGI